MSTEIETNIVAVERIKEYVEAPQVGFNLTRYTPCLIREKIRFMTSPFPIFEFSIKFTERHYWLFCHLTVNDKNVIDQFVT